MAYSYDDNNIFAKILSGEIPNGTVAENDHALAFSDINPAAPIHVLIIPKGGYVNYDDYLLNASTEEKTAFDALVLEVVVQHGLSSENGQRGYRVISNAGAWGLQEVPHYHLHLLSGEPIGPLRVR